MLENAIVTGELYPSLTYDEPKILCECACGCGEEIVEGYEYISYDDVWFAETECLMRYLGAEWREAE